MRRLPYLAARQHLALPCRRDPQGLTGPTKAEAAGPKWRRTSRGGYVLAEVERRPSNESSRQPGCCPTYGGVTGWASLHWQARDSMVRRNHVGGRRPPGVAGDCGRRHPAANRRSDQCGAAGSSRPDRCRRHQCHQRSPVDLLRDALRGRRAAGSSGVEHGGVLRPGVGRRTRRVCRPALGLDRNPSVPKSHPAGRRELLVTNRVGDGGGLASGRRAPTPSVQPSTLRPERPAHRHTRPARRRGRCDRSVQRRASSRSRPAGERHRR